jgi:hypothetical protein
VDRATGKVGGTKNPRKWGNFFDFRATYAEAPKLGGRISPKGRFEARRFRPNIIVLTGSEDPGFMENDWIGRTVVIGDTVRWPSPNHAPLRDDHAAAGRPTQRLRNPPDGRSAQRSKRRRLRLGDHGGIIRRGDTVVLA